MPYLIPQTDRTAEICTLDDELQFLQKRLSVVGQAGTRILIRQIAQVRRDIMRNREQIKAIL